MTKICPKNVITNNRSPVGGGGGDRAGVQGQMACFPGNFESSEGWTGDQKGWSGNLDR